jgi:hypothetical protein
VFADRTFGVGYLTAKWRFLRDWTLTGEYDFTYQHFGTLPGTPGSPASGTIAAIPATNATPAVSERSNQILVSVIWEPKRLN